MDFNVKTYSLEQKTLLEASAGTGKTWNICELYIRLLLEKKLETSQILVLTFTNAATAELKQRIRLRIQEGVEQSEPKSDQESTLKKALKTFDESMIYTIHTFCRKLLAQFSFSSGKPSSYQVETEDENKIIEEVAFDFWRKEVAFGNIDQRLANFIAEKRSPDSLINFLKRALAKPLAKYNWPEYVAYQTPQEEQILFDVYDTLLQKEEKLNQAIKTNDNHIIQVLQECKKTWLSDHAKIKTSLDKTALKNNSSKYADAFCQHCESIFNQDNPTFNQSLVKDFTQTKLSANTRKGNTSPNHPFFQKIENWLGLIENQKTLNNAQKELEKEFEVLTTRKYYRLLYNFLNCAFLTNENHETSKKEQNWHGAPQEVRLRQGNNRVLAINEMLFQVYDVLEKENKDSLLLKALQNSYKAALIDEFQDTDPIQLAIFNKIFPEPNVPVFFVGDPKQAIYRFRNADLHTYLSASEDIQQNKGTIATLTKNFRSTKEVIDAYNKVFTQKEAFVLNNIHYNEVSTGKTDLSLIDQSSLKHLNKGLVLWQLPLSSSAEFTNNQVDDLRNKAANKTAIEIKRLLKAFSDKQIYATTINDRKEKEEITFYPKDIVVLVPRRADAKRMQDMLSSYNIPSVAASPENNVWKSQESEELFRVLSAISTPKNIPRLRLALSTQLLGYKASDIEEISQDDQKQIAQMERFINYFTLWRRYGIGLVLKTLLTDYEIYARYLKLPFAERCLTNLQHLIELLNEAAVSYSSPEALLRYIAQQQSEAYSSDSNQLRLESDENVIQIMTVHASKGKEFPFVFCPFLWAGRPTDKGDNLEGIEHQDLENHTLTIDFEKTKDELRTERRIEELAERVRLIYVALTRAAYRTYLVCGCYNNTDSRQNALNWIVAPDSDPQTWVRNSSQDDTLFARIESGFQNLAQSSENIILESLDESIPSLEKTPIKNPKLTEDLLPEKSIPPAWRMGSYTSLSYDAKEVDDAIRGDDERTPVVLSVDDEETFPSGQVTPLQDDDILRFPRSNIAGDFIHSIFEKVDFTNPDKWNEEVLKALESKTPYGPSTYQKKLENEVLAQMLNKMLDHVLSTPLLNDLSLNKISLDQRLSELRFFMPVNQLQAEKLNERFEKYTHAQYSFKELTGYLNGAIDLVFEYQDKFYILDWKSNYLCKAKENLSIEEAQKDYNIDGVTQAMASHHYHLQYLIYTVALNRYLKTRLPHYDYEKHFGGVFYLFVRGVRPHWKNQDGSPLGVFYTKTDRKVIEDLDQLINGEI